MLRRPRCSALVRPPRRLRSLPLSAITLTLLLASALGLACRATTPGLRPATAIVSPEWEALNIQSLGFVTVGSSVGDEVARQIAEDIVVGQLASNQERFVILNAQTARARAAAATAGDTFDRLVKVWRSDRLADKFLVQGLCTKMGVDGLLFGELNDWKCEKVDAMEEGSASTQVAMRLAIFSGKTGMTVWEAQKTIRRESEVYTPAGGGGASDPGSYNARAQRSSGLTPEPPRPEDVAVDVLASIMAAFPPRPAK